MLEDNQALLGMTAGMIAVIGEIWYNRTILSGATSPDRSAWWLLLVSGVLATSGHAALGGGWSVVLPAVITLGTVVTALLSLLRGAAIPFGRLDAVMLLVALAAVAVWVAWDLPIVTLLTMLAVDAAGMACNMRKAWRMPGKEAAGPWGLAVSADLLNVMAVGEAEAGMILPWFMLVTNAMMLTTVLAAARRAVTTPASTLLPSAAEVVSLPPY